MSRLPDPQTAVRIMAAVMCGALTHHLFTSGISGKEASRIMSFMYRGPGSPQGRRQWQYDDDRPRTELERRPDRLPLQLGSHFPVIFYPKIFLPLLGALMLVWLTVWILLLTG